MPGNFGLKRSCGARASTRQIAGHFSDTTLKALQHLMAEDGMSLQALLDDLLIKKGRAKLLAECRQVNVSTR